jgi:hypothetical protein
MPEYTNAIYVKGFLGNEISIITVDINGVLTFVPIAPGNTDYSNIMQLVESGNLIIKPADEANN